MAKGMVINGETFRTQAEVRGRVREILRRASLHAELAGADFAFVRALLDRHPEASEKIGAGLATIAVEPGLNRQSRRFSINRVDGSTIDFSFETCIRGRASTQAEDLRAACRLAIVPTKHAWRDLVFSQAAAFTCPITGEVITVDTAHVDHAPPNTFEAIVEAFEREHGIPPLAEGPGGIGVQFASAEDACRFLAFHNARAQLRLVSARANLSDLRRGAR